MRAVSPGHSSPWSGAGVSAGGVRQVLPESTLTPLDLPLLVPWPPEAALMGIGHPGALRASPSAAAPSSPTLHVLGHVFSVMGVIGCPWSGEGLEGADLKG